MGSILDAPKEIVLAVRDTLQALLEVLNIFKRHLFFTIGLAICVSLYAAGLWLTYGMPKQTIHKYYQLLQEKAEISHAWNLLDRNYQKIWVGDPQRLQSGYKTTVAYSEMRIETQGRAWNPFGFAFFNSLTFDVSFVVEDRLSKADLADPLQQRSNCKWLSIAHSTDYPRLEDGTLGFETLPMKRRYKQVVLLKRANWRTWLIAGIQNRECGLIFQ